MEDGHYRRYFYSFASSVSVIPLISPSHLISQRFPPAFSPFPFFFSSFFRVIFSRTVHRTEYAQTDSTAPFAPSLPLSSYPFSIPVLQRIPPTLSSPPGSSQRCTTHVLTERRTSDLRGSRCDPLRVRHPPDGGRLGVAPRAVLSPSRRSRRLSSRLETIRYAGDPGPSTLRTRVRDGTSARHEVNARLARLRNEVLFIVLSRAAKSPSALFRPDSALLLCGPLRLARFNADRN